MFRCQICGQTAPAGTRATKVVLASRSKRYASRGGNPEGFQRRFRGAPPPKKDFDKGGTGTEIVREVLACAACAKEAEPTEPVEPVVADIEITQVTPDQSTDTDSAE